ncbi:MAG: MipA/OmpV family protein [Gallionella sp.]|nr:MipA/OmpV family protein [Gallionella sp.]
MIRRSITILAAGCLMTAAAFARGEQPADTPVATVPARDTTPPAAAAGRPLWEAGLLGLAITQPAYPGSEERVSRLLGLPYLIYRGKYLRAERGNVGLRALKTPRTELDLGFAASLGSPSSDIAARQGMANLGTLIEFGPRLKVNLGNLADIRRDSRFQFPLREVIDVSHGFVSRGITFEPEWVRDTRLREHWLLSTNLGMLFGDTTLADTFYGVSPGDATPTRNSYSAKGGLFALRAGLFVSHSVSPDLRLFYSFRIESLAGAANRDSPLVRRRLGWGAVIGFAYTMARSEQPAEE